jgi:hypothetical protein
MTIQHFQWWHRSLGFLAAMLVIFIAGTGLLLNHTDELELDQVMLDSDWILSLYGIEVESDPVAFKAGQTWLSRYGSRLYVNDQDTGQNTEQLIGVVELEDLLLVAVPDSLLLMTSSGEFVEKIAALPGISGTLLAMGKIGDIPVLQTTDGSYAGDMELTAWRQIRDDGPVWAVPERLPDQILRQIELKHHGEGVSLERFVLDVHSGAVLGKVGKYLSDLFAILILLLSLSGLWVSRLRRRMNLAAQAGVYNDR